MLRIGLSVLLFLVSPIALAQAPALHMVEMRDGVALATDVYVPAGGQPVPILLRQTPYGRALDATYVNQVLNLGFGIVSQDVRGRGGSEGVYLPFNDAANDGFDTIEWIAAQSFSNGKVGTIGGSAEGIVQLFTAAQATPPPALKCAHVAVATGDMYEAILQGGAWREELGTNWLNGLGEPEALEEVRRHEALDDFWAPVRLSSEELAAVSIPILHIGGYFDVFARGTTRTHAALKEVAAAKDSQYLLLGPWTHGGTASTVQGEVTFPSSAAYAGSKPTLDLLNFFNWCLKDGGAPSFPAAQYYVTELSDDGTSATGEWRAGTAWPPEAVATSLFLHADGELRTAAPVQEAAPSAIPVDPLNPVPTIGGANLTIAAGIYDQSELAARPDVLTMQTAPFASTAEIIGDAQARVWASSATDDVDVIVKIEQVTPNGGSMLLADGARRGRFVQGFDAIRPLTPDTAALFEVDLGPIGIRVPEGHALRISISGTSSPRYEPNKNVAVPLTDTMTQPITTTLSVFHDPMRASEVILPLASGELPAGSGLTEPEPDGGTEPVAPGGADAGAGGGGGVAPTGCGCSSEGSGFSVVALMGFALVLASRRRVAARVHSRRR